MRTEKIKIGTNYVRLDNGNTLGIIFEWIGEVGFNLIAKLFLVDTFGQIEGKVKETLVYDFCPKNNALESLKKILVEIKTLSSDFVSEEINFEFHGMENLKELFSE